MGEWELSLSDSEHTSLVFRLMLNPFTCWIPPRGVAGTETVPGSWDGWRSERVVRLWVLGRHMKAGLSAKKRRRKVKDKLAITWDKVRVRNLSKTKFLPQRLRKNFRWLKCNL